MEDAAALLLSAEHIVGQTVAVAAEVDGPSLDVGVGVVAGIGRRKKDHRPLMEAAVVGLGSASGWPNLANWARVASEGVALGTTFASAKCVAAQLELAVAALMVVAYQSKLEWPAFG